MKFSILGRIICLVTVWIWALLSAQHVSAQLNESPAITRLMEKWKTYNLEHEEIPGWRIQILATVDRRQMENVMRKFENLYPEYPIHSTHNDPYYQLKTGAFLTVQKAQAFQKKLQAEYPTAIVVNDNLKVDELLHYDQ